MICAVQFAIEIEHSSGMFENKVLGRIYVQKRRTGGEIIA
jgi:hypothetical protein